MISERINEELDNLIYYINEYKIAEINLSKKIDKRQIEEANNSLEINLLAIQNIFNLNHELKNIVLRIPVAKDEYIKDSFLTTHFVDDIKDYIKRVENYNA